MNRIIHHLRQYQGAKILFVQVISGRKCHSFGLRTLWMDF
ncbi:E3 ubiquitin-ligase SopA domain protein [Salmonella enterica subsp. enterica serovar Typhi]|nr:E3 ubiquitin-ligase SopA domain protein [Salmonella enterica subsp. enterica serovar Typhi]